MQAGAAWSAPVSAGGQALVIIGFPDQTAFEYVSLDRCPNHQHSWLLGRPADRRMLVSYSGSCRHGSKTPVGLTVEINRSHHFAPIGALECKLMDLRKGTNYVTSNHYVARCIRYLRHRVYFDYFN